METENKCARGGTQTRVVTSERALYLLDLKVGPVSNAPHHFSAGQRCRGSAVALRMRLAAAQGRGRQA